MSTNTASIDTRGDVLLVVVLATGLLLVEAPGVLQGLWLVGLVVGGCGGSGNRSPRQNRSNPDPTRHDSGLA